MSIRVNNLILNINEDMSELKSKAARKLGINVDDIEKFSILRKSIDARRKNNIKFNCSVEVSCQEEEKLVLRTGNRDVKLEKRIEDTIVPGNKKMSSRPIIVGMGPAGMFAGLFLAEEGYRPIVVERGEKIEDRTKTVNKFWTTGELNLESNVQFGEGGAGTFSDGKLTTRIKDRRCDFILDAFSRYGAPNEILYDGKPHIGTDNLKLVVKNIRNRILELGGEILFNSRLEDLVIEDKKLKEIIVNGARMHCENLILAIGHSSRDTYEMLFKKGVHMEPKAFAIGVRVEHLQHMIDVNQYGKFAGNPKLGPADYRLTYKSRNGRGIYSFCMCPGGEVVAAASERGELVTNGMSYYKRNLENANSAVVVTVGEDDFEGNSPLKGMEFQRYYEKLAYKLGGGNYAAPVQLIRDFLKERVSTGLGSVKPTYRPGYEFRDLRLCLPAEVVSGLQEGFVHFERKIKGYAKGEGVITGIETRTSAPVRIIRSSDLESISVSGMYPCGEGAGYAGGIISAAADGIKTAEGIIRKYSPL
ncbi:NAD(P)/FAD-dependent oxidoreductase [Clostridium luticellarii]|jgi:uncharacterized FAD-dependent dehydrogenase|uniref:HI0933-like protein n=2 Tax=Clostridium luticellarii TaxID=1691940 RepID=A0A2T0BS91_9CLOT|nr:NAD(P)/FAD-dependent oxidoreductase [Clostridium luticellarii]PRR86761.1 HI0933-like protein [Clostridium luticellarii]